jgi:glycosyltransferase involved in cell wall biosynthesis
MKINLLSIDLEPAPYKVDLWNAFISSGRFNVTVYFTQFKDLSRDAGHNYQVLPDILFHYVVLTGQGLVSTLQKTFYVLSGIRKSKCDGVFISGYVDASQLASIIYCSLFKVPFFLHSDVFNTSNPSGRFPILKRWVRESIRLYIFRHASAVLVCGKLGISSAVEAGCPTEKIIDFPYVIDVNRMMDAVPEQIPEIASLDVLDRKNIIYFSGRMIARKGLAVLLEAASILAAQNNISDWVIWIEGDGPQFIAMQDLARKLGVSERCRFFGFVQMHLHSWLINHSIIVVVPSIKDPWGIIVDEGMQLGKVVIASTGVGSAIDRIQAPINGILFEASNAPFLANQLIKFLENPALLVSIGRQAKEDSQAFIPKRNVDALYNFLTR